MTRRHYESTQLKRYERPKLIRRSWRYRLHRWARRVGRRIDAVSGWIRMWLLLTLGAYFTVAVFTGPGSGLLPEPWDEIICAFGAVAVTVWEIWYRFVPAESKKK